MFTGLIEECGRLIQSVPMNGGLLLRIEAEMSPKLSMGDSVAVQGVCQTVVRLDRRWFAVQALEQTIRKTTLSRLKPGAMLNLERALSPLSRMDGHLVQGHVDATGEVLDVRRQGDNRYLSIRLPKEQAALCVSEGSVAVDGISLTIARLEEDVITINVIPHSWAHSSLSSLKPGSLVNIESDVMARYAMRFYQSARGNGVDGRPAAAGRPVGTSDGLLAALEKGGYL